MERIITKSKSGSTVYVETIYYLVTKPNTYAASVLLRAHYEALDETNLKSFSGRMKMVGFSRGFLTRVQNDKGCLTCEYCKRPNLTIEMENMKVPNAKKATIDHVIPLSQGADPFDETNLVVACGKCNSRKGSMSKEDFVKIVKPYDLVVSK